jgi:hypothetical protein
MARKLPIVSGHDNELLTRLGELIRGIEREPQPLDDFLADQGQTGFTATIEPVTKDPTRVKITPWLPNAGCMCQFALEVPTKTVATVTPTGDRHFCCGKALRVVEVRFQSDAQISLADIFGQIGEKLRGGRELDRPFASSLMSTHA